VRALLMDIDLDDVFPLDDEEPYPEPPTIGEIFYDEEDE
jgi:hypothetical protein